MRTSRLTPTATAMLTPMLLGVSAVFGYPVYRAARLAFVGDVSEGGGHGAGLSNFARLVVDPAFLFALVNTTAYALVYTALLVATGTGLALLARRVKRGGGLFRGVLFTPYLVGPVYLAVVAVGVLETVGGRASAVLGVPWLVMPVVLVISLWAGSGMAMLYLLAALEGVDAEQQEAARVDGCGEAGVFWHVTLPAIRPTLAFVALTGAVGGMTLFELPFVLFGGPGPGNAAVTLSMVLFAAQFEHASPAYAAAMGWVMALLLTGITAVLVRMSVRADRPPEEGVARA